MAGTVTFILKNPESKKDKENRSNKETPVYLVFWYDQIRIKISTGERIKPKFWNSADHRARETKPIKTELQNINTRLNTIEGDVMNTVRDHLNENGKIIPEKLKRELKDVIKPKPQDDPKQMTLFSSIREYIAIANKAPKTIVSYNMTLNTLLKYNEILKKDLTFDDIDIDFYENFVRFLTYDIQYTWKKDPENPDINKIKTGYSKNTIANRIKNLKVFMNYANDKGYTTNQWHKHRKFKKVEETAETIYLNENDLSILYSKDLSYFPKLDRVRDLFIIGCYTGLRFSDLSQITPDKFNKDGTQLKIKTIKTGETVIIPLHWTIKEILHKYNGNLPRVISNQKMNEYVKDLGKLSKINEHISITKTTQGLSSDRTFEKWELMSVHTARRSFATNMFLAEVPTISIMKITGHRTERAFMKYIKITQEQNADKLSKHPYFTKSPLKVVNQ